MLQLRHHFRLKANLPILVELAELFGGLVVRVLVFGYLGNACFAAEDGNAPPPREPESAGLRAFYTTLQDQHPRPPEYFLQLEAKHPNVIKSELIRLISLESEYYDASDPGSLLVWKASGVAAELYGDDGQVFGRLLSLIQAVNKIHKGTLKTNATTTAIIRGLCKNKSKTATNRLVYLIDSNVLTYNERLDAYVALIDRLTEGRDDPGKILEILDHYANSESDSEVKNKLLQYFKDFEIESRLRNWKANGRRVDLEFKNLPAPKDNSNSGKRNDKVIEGAVDNAARSSPCESWYLAAGMGGFFVALIIICVKLITRLRK